MQAEYQRDSPRMSPALHNLRHATTSLEGWDTSSRPPGALGLGHWPRVPRGSYSHLGLCCPPRSLILGGRALAWFWVGLSQWGLAESTRAADGKPVIHQH